MQLLNILPSYLKRHFTLYLKMQADIEIETESDSFDVDILRGEFESNTEWKLRRKFLYEHHTLFSIDTLICMSNCFINMELHGCKYPIHVMDRINKLTEFLWSDLQDLKTFKREKHRTVLFVKSSNQDYFTPLNSEDTESLVMESDPDNITELYTTKPEGISRHKKLKVKDTHVDTNQELTEKFKLLTYKVHSYFKIQGAIQLMNLSVEKTKMTICSSVNMNSEENGGFTCVVLIDFVRVAAEVGRTKKKARASAYETALEKIKKPYRQIVENDDGNPVLEVSDNPFPMHIEGNSEYDNEDNTGAFIFRVKDSNEKSIPIEKRNNEYQSRLEISSFIIMEQPNMDNINAISTLRRSADFSQTLIKYGYLPIHDGFACRLLVKGECIRFDAEGKTSAVAKLKASEIALESLRDTCWTMKMKNKKADSDDPDVSREELLGEIKKQAIPETNIGNKMLRKMGWTGGGVGKEGNKGIVEPITVKDVIRREGLGMEAENGISRGFSFKVKAMLVNYVRRGNVNDMCFAPEFTKEERAIIHKESLKLGLKSNSHGKGDNRCLTISRKRTANQLVQHIASMGGSTSKYELIPPRNIYNQESCSYSEME